MEEILASIRRIIADDDAKAAASVTAQAPSAAPPPAPAMSSPVPSPRDFLRDIPPAPPPPKPAAKDEAADILELTEHMRTEPEPPMTRFTTVNAQPDVVFAESPPERESPPQAVMMAADLPDADSLDDALGLAGQIDQALSEHAEMDRPLLSRSATAAVDSAFASLTHTVLSQNARTLDDLVKEMLRPMLKSWLDDNLPSLVERLVRAEIERVSRGH